MITEIVDSYFKSRPNTKIPHGKIAVLFLACSGSGKSTITQKLVTELGVTYLRNDDARELIQEYHLDIPPKIIIDATWKKMRLESKNQLIIFDSNMSGYYMHEDSYYSVARQEGYQTFIIAINLPLDELERRVQARQRHDTQEVLGILPEQLEAQKKAMAVLHPNFTATKDIDYRQIIKALRQFEEAPS